MSRSWWLRFIFCLFCVIGSILFIYPTITNLDVETSKFPIKQKMNLGLDLQGGVYLVLGVDFHKLFHEVLEKQIVALEDHLKKEALTVQSIERPKWMSASRPASAPSAEKIADQLVNQSLALLEDPRFQVVLAPPVTQDLKGTPSDSSNAPISDQKDKILALVKKELPLIRLTADEVGRLQFGLSADYRRDLRNRTVNQSIEVIRSRIDEFGVTEPVISSQGLDRIVVELPGVKNVERAKELIGRTAQLEFRLVRTDVASKTLEEWVLEVEKKLDLKPELKKQKPSSYLAMINEGLREKLPKDVEIGMTKERDSKVSLDKKVEDEEGEEDFQESEKFFLLSKSDKLSGSNLQDVSVQYADMERRPIVSFTLTPKGAMDFAKLTGEHVGKRLAIVLDDMVYSAPGISQRITGGKAQISLGRGGPEEAMKEAKDLALVLRAGSLPAQLDFLEQRVIGPSLGQDSIQKGALASLIGSLLVFVFVALYYKVSGVIAVISLMLNVLFVLALLVGLEATLTLPGIAGIALTVGIAVDSNVVIYERIREELRLGKRPHTAVMAGFEKAFRTILDANVTNAVASLVLLMYGTGPIKGFAVTLLIGIVTTLFTAVFICRLIFELYLAQLSKKRQTTISI